MRVKRNSEIVYAKKERYFEDCSYWPHLKQFWTQLTACSPSWFCVWVWFPWHWVQPQLPSLSLCWVWSISPLQSLRRCWLWVWSLSWLPFVSAMIGAAYAVVTTAPVSRSPNARSAMMDVVCFTSQKSSTDPIGLKREIVLAWNRCFACWNG